MKIRQFFIDVPNILIFLTSSRNTRFTKYAADIHLLQIQHKESVTNECCGCQCLSYLIYKPFPRSLYN